MKKIIYTVTLLFFVTFLMAQKNKIAINSQISPYFDNTSKASIGLQYFRKTKIGTLGLKTNYFFSKENPTKQFAFVDAVYRLNLKKNPNRFQWHYDVGFAYFRERYYHEPTNYKYCDVGLTPEKLKEMNEQNLKSYWVTDNYFGISNAIGFDCAFKNFTFGFDVNANVYYDFDFQDVMPYFAPNLSVGYRF
jgi:hypothetical protein